MKNIFQCEEKTIESKKIFKKIYIIQYISKKIYYQNQAQNKSYFFFLQKNVCETLIRPEKWPYFIDSVKIIFRDSNYFFKMLCPISKTKKGNAALANEFF